MILALNISLVFAGGAWYLHDGSHRLFAEMGLIDVVESVELMIAGLAGIAAFRIVRRRTAPLTPTRGAPDTGYWGLSGVALVVFGLDDLFALHERTRGWFDRHPVLGSSLTNSGDDVLTVAVAAMGVIVLFVYRHEILARRRSSNLLVLGAALAALMIGFDAFAKGWTRAFEFPCQAAAIGLLLSSYLTRLEEAMRPTQRSSERLSIARLPLPP